MVRHWGLLLACCITMWARVGWAQTPVFQSELSAPGDYYPGRVFALTVGYDDAFETFGIDSMQVTLPAFLELVGIAGSDGQPLFDAASLQACDPSGPPYACAPQICTAPACPLLDIAVEPLVASSQQVHFSGGIDFHWPTFTLFVRMVPNQPCSTPTAAFLDSNIDVAGPLNENNVLNGCNAAVTLEGLTTVPINIVAPRAASPVSLDVEIQAIVGGTPMPISVPATSVGDFAATFACALPDGGFGNCLAPPFANFMTVSLVRETPLTVRLQAQNNATPLAGDARLSVTVPGLVGATILPVTVEQNATTFQAAVTSGSAAIVDAGFAQLGIVATQNTLGGFEPTLATWSLVGVTPAAQTALASSWFDAGLARVEVLQAPPEAVTLTLRATHINPDASTVTSDVVVAVSPEPIVSPPGTCRVVADSQTLGVGAATALEVVVVDALGVEAPATSAVSWSVVAGEGEIVNAPLAQHPSRAMYQAPTRGPVTARIRADLAGMDCSQTEAFLTLQVDVDVRVVLLSQVSRVTANDVWLVRAQVQNLAASAASDLQLVFGGDFSLQPLNNKPLPVTFVGGNVAHQEAAFLVRANVPCGPLTANVSVLRGGQTITGASVQVTATCEPGLSYATLIGRVFIDNNGDGQQDDGELGVPNVMVATSASVYARTDAWGSYHIERMQPGRHVVKVDSADLPPGARFTTDARRDVTLTAGMFTRVSFGVQLPALADVPTLSLKPEASGPDFDNGAAIYRARFDVPNGYVLSAQRDGARVVAQQTSPQQWDLALPMDPLRTHWLLDVAAHDGRHWFYSFALYTYQQEEGELLVPLGPRYLGGVTLPSTAAATPRVALMGNAEQGVIVSAWGQSKEQACDVALHTGNCWVMLASDAPTVYLRIDAGADALGDDPPAFEIATPLPVLPVHHFSVGRGFVDVGELFTDPQWNAGGAFFYRGQYLSGWLLTAGADATARDLLLKPNGQWRSLSGISTRLFAHDNNTVFRDLDPERYYPTLGDASVTVDEREAGGRFFARLQKGNSYVKWGGVNTAITDVEVGQYIRSLYGLGAHLDLLGVDAPVQLAVQAFAAKPETNLARDELPLTGSSLYFLAHRAVVQGSLRVQLEILDEISGLPERVVALVEGVDYEADYAGGNLSLDSALPVRTFGSLLTSRQGGGNRGRLIVDYEYQPEMLGVGDFTLGARIKGTTGPLSVGVLAAGELANTQQGVANISRRYTLVGATARFEVGSMFSARAELARSEGGVISSSRSINGGLLYRAAPASLGQSGNAMVLELRTDLQTLVGVAYGRVYDNGFNDSRTAIGSGRKQFGLKVNTTLVAKTRAYAHVDVLRETALANQTRVLALAGGARAFGAWTLGVEGRFETLWQTSEERVVAGASVAYALAPHWVLALRRRHNFVDSRAVPLNVGAGETALRLTFENSSNWALGAEAGLTDRGVPFGRLSGGVPLVDGTELYASYAIASDLDATALLPSERERGGRLVLGGVRRVQGTRLYAEESFRMDGKDREALRRVGAETPLTRHVGLTLSYERGALLAPTERLFRDAGSVGVILAFNNLNARASVDARYDQTSPTALLQLGGVFRADYRASEELTLAGSMRGGSTYLLDAGTAPGAQLWEGTVGAALRPKSHERWQAFGRYALTQERRPQQQANDLTRLSHVGALVVLFNIVSPIDVGPKVYYRYTTASWGDERATDHALLTALRGDYHVTQTWDASLEGRICASPKSGAATQAGALAEASVLALPWLRLGAGYNLSHISTSSVQCEEPGARGAYVRAEAVY